MNVIFLQETHNALVLLHLSLVVEVRSVLSPQVATQFVGFVTVNRRNIDEFVLKIHAPVKTFMGLYRDVWIA